MTNDEQYDDCCCCVPYLHKIALDTDPAGCSLHEGCATNCTALVSSSPGVADLTIALIQCAVHHAHKTDKTAGCQGKALAGALLYKYQ